jgi:NAD-dependent deacetylase
MPAKEDIMAGHKVSALDIPRNAAVVVLTGAGVSAESGIATFRDSGGLWEQHRVEDVATHEGFVKNPELVWRFYSLRRKDALRVHPNPAHYAIAALEEYLADKGSFTLITQNVDGLHRRAGNKNVLEIHGSLFKTKCDNPRCPASETPFDDETTDYDALPKCEKCGGLLRPDIVWFGEQLDRVTEAKAMHAVGECEIFLTIGTSGVVWPVAGYSRLAYELGARTITANLEPPANVQNYREVYLGKAGEVVPMLLANVLND